MSKPAADIQILPLHWRDDSAALAAIRREVFIDEQNVPEDLEWDGEDTYARHWLALINNEPIGTVRLLRNGHVGRMAVRKAWRNQGIGAALLRAVIGEAFAQDLRELYLHAQTHAVDFYARHGFVAEGPEFMDAGIPHRTMRLLLHPQRRLGHDHGRFAVTNPRAMALDLARQAQRHVRILSNELDPDIYDNAEFTAALSQLVRNYRGADIRILIVDSSELAQTSHALVALTKRLSSAIKIRKLGAPNELLPENYLIADGRGLLCLSQRDTTLAWADYNNKPLAGEYTKSFDDLWSHAQEDPYLRALHI